ncbi:MAG: class II glutamine amidotransferase [Deltaproteobacteria bacterium]|nr:class II glutamine amidotransferase [Deltaproteobacteria bacterium]
MCRWLAYAGAPIFLDELIFKAKHSLVDQSKDSKLGELPMNGDGFGVGWYGRRDWPGVFHDTQPAWNDRNLREIAAQIEAPVFLAHIRATTGTAVQQTNCHPFRHGNWLFMHNGVIREFEKIRRELVLAVDPALFSCIEGTTDTEVLFYLALTFGLRDDPHGAIAKMAGFVEAVGRGAGIANPLMMTLGISDGERLYAVRYSSEADSRTLFYSRDMLALKHLHPSIDRFSDDARVIVSEPLSGVDDWVPIDEGTWIVVDGGHVETRAFAPAAP